MLFCHPTLPIITHKEETALIPPGQMCSHILRANKNNTEREGSMNMQPVFFPLISSSWDASDAVRGKRKLIKPRRHPTLAAAIGPTGRYANPRFVVKTLFSSACGRGVGQNFCPEFACIESQSASPRGYSINYTVVHSKDEQGCRTLQVRVCGLWYWLTIIRNSTED